MDADDSDMKTLETRVMINSKLNLIALSRMSKIIYFLHSNPCGRQCLINHMKCYNVTKVAIKFSKLIMKSLGIMVI